MHTRAFHSSLSALAAMLLAAFSSSAAATDTLRCVPGATKGTIAASSASATEGENMIVLDVDPMNKTVRIQKGPWSGPALVVQSWTDQNIQVVQRQNRSVQDRFYVQQTLTFQIDRTSGLFKMTPSFASPEGRPMSRDDVLRKLKEHGIRAQYADLPMEPVTALCSPMKRVFSGHDQV